MNGRVKPERSEKGQTRDGTSRKQGDPGRRAHLRRAVVHPHLPMHLASPHPHRASSRRGPACCLLVHWLCAAEPERACVRIRTQELVNLDARGATAKEGVLASCSSAPGHDAHAALRRSIDLPSVVTFGYCCTGCPGPLSLSEFTWTGDRRIDQKP